MAATFLYQRGAESIGPVRFRELVRLVRVEELGADDLVKADWEEVWRPAATVVGLFKMAGRADVLARWEAERLAAEQATIRQDVTPLAAQAAGTEENAAEGGLSFATAADLNQLLGLAPLHMEQEALPHAGQVGELERAADEAAYCDTRVDDTAPGNPRGMQSAIDAAMEEAEAKEVSREKAQRPSIWSRFDVTGLGAGTLRWGSVLLFANLTAIGILSWSELQAQRFPERSAQVARAEIFPLWGRCSPREYAFLFTDSIAVAGFCGFLVARCIEQRAEDSPHA